MRKNPVIHTAVQETVSSGSGPAGEKSCKSNGLAGRTEQCHRTRAILLPESCGGYCDKGRVIEENCGRLCCYTDRVEGAWGEWSSCNGRCECMGHHHMHFNITQVNAMSFAFYIATTPMKLLVMSMFYIKLATIHFY